MSPYVALKKWYFTWFYSICINYLKKYWTEEGLDISYDGSGRYKIGNILDGYQSDSNLVKRKLYICLRMESISLELKGFL